MSPSSVVDYAVATAATSVRAVFYHSIASLALLVWNCFVTFDDEVQYIWTMRNKKLFKWGYFFLRYVVLLAHITHNSLIGTLADGSNPPRLCDIRFFYVATSSQAFESSLEFILASRVFALYNRSRKVAILLLFLILMEAGGTVKTIWLRKTTDIYGTCLLLRPTSNHGHQTALGFTVHFMLISMTLFKYFLARKAGWGRTPLISLVVRDGSTVYATMLFWLISAAIMLGMENKEAIALCFWISAFISISGCRMILSMERFARRANSVESPPNQPFLTSQFNLWTLDFGRALGNHQLDHNVTLPLT